MENVAENSTTGRDPSARGPDEIREAAEPAREEPPREYRGTGIYAAVVVGLLFTLAVVILAVQNVDTVTLEWLAWDIDVSLTALILASLLVGAAAAVIGGLFWRRRRRRVLTEREELRGLRLSGHRSDG
jgi:uncharacterized integral membrane protein